MKALSRKRGVCLFLNCSQINLNISVRSLNDCSPALCGNVSPVTAQHLAVGSCSPGPWARSSGLKCLKCQAGLSLGKERNSEQLRAELGMGEKIKPFFT